MGWGTSNGYIISPSSLRSFRESNESFYGKRTYTIKVPEKSAFMISFSSIGTGAVDAVCECFIEIGKTVGKEIQWETVTWVRSTTSSDGYCYLPSTCVPLVVESTETIRMTVLSEVDYVWTNINIVGTTDFEPTIKDV